MADAVVTITRANTSELYLPLVVNLFISGTATFNTDYTVIGATSFTATFASVTILANQTSTTITLSSIADSAVEQDETVIMTLAPTAGVSIGSGSITWVITNDDTEPQISNTFSVSTSTELTISQTFSTFRETETTISQTFSSVL